MLYNVFCKHLCTLQLLYNVQCYIMGIFVLFLSISAGSKIQGFGILLVLVVIF